MQTRSKNANNYTTKNMDVPKKENDDKRWTDEEDMDLLIMIARACNYNTGHENYTCIANMLKRTEDAVKARFVKTILFPRYNKETLEGNMDKICNTFYITKEDMTRYIKYVVSSPSPVMKYCLKEIIYNKIAI